MKNIQILFLSILICSNAFGQDDFNTRWTAAFELATAEQYDEALAAFEPLLLEQPSYAETHVQMAWCYMMKGNMEEAGARGQIAFQLDQLSPSVFAINAYLLYVMGMDDGGIIFLNDAIWLLPNDEDLAFFDKDISQMKKAGLEVTKLETDLKSILTNVETRDKSWATIQTKFFEGVDLLNQGEMANAKTTLKSIFPLFDKVPEQQQRFGFHVAYVIGTYYYNVGDSTNYMKLLSKSYSYMKENMTRNYRILLHMNSLIGAHHFTYGNYEKSFEILSDGLNHYSFINSYRFLGDTKAQFLSQYAASALAVGNLTEARDAGRLVTELTYTGYDEWYSTNALIYIAQSWEQENAETAQEYYQKAYDLASESGFEDLKNSIAENLK